MLMHCVEKVESPNAGTISVTGSLTPDGKASLKLTRIHNEQMVESIFLDELEYKPVCDAIEKMLELLARAQRSY